MNKARVPGDHITPEAERRILQALSDGYSGTEIARSCGLTPTTISKIKMRALRAGKPLGDARIGKHPRSLPTPKESL